MPIGGEGKEGATEQLKAELALRFSERVVARRQDLSLGENILAYVIRFYTRRYIDDPSDRLFETMTIVMALCYTMSSCTFTWELDL